MKLGYTHRVSVALGIASIALLTYLQGCISVLNSNQSLEEKSELILSIKNNIEERTQWVIFEPNSESLWSRYRIAVSRYLYEIWRSGILVGAQSREAYFVRCDRSTMSQKDIDNGQLVAIVGVATSRPGEFTIIRIQQNTGSVVDK
jgi:phage tail sheath protein FI